MKLPRERRQKLDLDTALGDDWDERVRFPRSFGRNRSIECGPHLHTNPVLGASVGEIDGESRRSLLDRSLQLLLPRGARLQAAGMFAFVDPDGEAMPLSLGALLEALGERYCRCTVDPCVGKKEAGSGSLYLGSTNLD